MAQVHAKPQSIAMSARSARILSIGVIVALIAAYACHGAGYLLAASLLKAGGLLGALALFITPFGVLANAPDALLDERQRAERDRAYPLAHQIIVGTLFAAFLYAIAAEAFGWWMPGRDTALDLLSAFAIAALAVPSAILAWRAAPDAD